MVVKYKPAKQHTADPTLDPLCVSPQRASELTSICLSAIHSMVRSGELESTLRGGRRLIFYASLKRVIIPDRVRRVRKGKWNRTGEGLDGKNSATSGA